MLSRLAVVISQSPSLRPANRQLEEALVAGLLADPAVEVTIVPHLYDLHSAGPAWRVLQGMQSELVVMSWLYPRAARWILDRNGVRGSAGKTLIRWPDETDARPAETGKEWVLDQRPAPQRDIYCLDLRLHPTAEPFLAEVGRIAAEIRSATVETPDETKPASRIMRIEEPVGRRWYPVIDFSRCTNCMECIDFCLFGVYGIDATETILVEQPDNCRKGCPACSRVCPEHAILFPHHKTAAISGGAARPEALKIDLSQLFGDPNSGPAARDVAVQERGEQLRLAGLDTPRPEAELPKRQSGKTSPPKDDLDRLLDALD